MVSLLVLLVASVVVGVATAALELADFGRVQAIHDHDGRSETDAFSNEWVVHLVGGGDVADLTALRLGYLNIGELPSFPDHYLMRKNDQESTMRDESPHHTENLRGQSRVLWAQQMFRKVRVKRWIVPEEEREEPAMERLGSLEDEDFLEYMKLRMRSMMSTEDDERRGIPPDLLQMWEEEEAAVKAKHGEPVAPEPKDRLFNDLLWDHQWYMQDTRSRSDLPYLSLNIVPVYAMGLTGKGVRVCVIDDGLEHTHDDLRDNYDPEISYDYQNGTAGDADPSPVYGKPTTPNSHGTRCAGEIAMAANNRVCGVGVAHGARIGGIRMLDGDINDRLEGLSLQHALDKVDIFTASWGPSDDGKTVEAPGHLAMKALKNGVTTGRQGKGVIYVWASGNGGQKGDNCNCDGYTSSIYTVSIGSASEQGEFPWYGEKCASTVAVAFSSGAYSDQKIATTDNNNTCTVSHTGTSAAAPLAAGIIALALEANPSLTWRDVQHLVVRSSSSVPLADNPGWQTNAAGRRFNSRFGFGLMDAEAMVGEAKRWRNVGGQRVSAHNNHVLSDNVIRSSDSLSVDFSVLNNVIRQLEHVEVVANIDYPVRGALEVALVSPSGTISQLLTARSNDKSDAGFKDWRFMTVHFWGEDPSGDWKLHVIDRTSTEVLQGKAGNFQLILYGTEELESEGGGSEPTPEASVELRMRQ